MDLAALDKAFQTKSEIEVVRLMTCNFDLGSYSLVEKAIPKNMAELFRYAIKFRSHLSVQSTTLDNFINKIEGLLDTLNMEFHGSASKLCGYSGELLTKSKTFLGTPDELVSFNEYGYLVKLYPWWVNASNKTFETYVDKYISKKAFFCLPSFDLNCLKDKSDVISVSEDKIVLEGKITLPVIRVDV